MKLLRAPTLCVAGLNHPIDTCCEWLDYSLEEQGEVDNALAASWGLVPDSRDVGVMKLGKMARTHSPARAMCVTKR
jgi:hypothetical protein